MPIDMPYVDGAGSVKLYYEDFGSGKCILFVHGFSMSHEIWSYQVAALADKARIVAIDLRGHGNSDKPDSSYNHDEFALDVLKIMQNLRLKDVNLVGWSLGGSIALRYMRNHGDRVKKLVLVGTGPRFYKAKDYPYGADPATGKEQAQRWLSDLPGATTEFCRRLVKDELPPSTLDWLVQMTLDAPLLVKMRISSHRGKSDHRPMLGSIKIPTVVFHGRYDSFTAIGGAKYTARKIPNAKLEVFETGHSPMIEAKDDFNHRLARFLDL
jgi:pimeloyl-ACP methyl ester carboxylesterase